MTVNINKTTPASVRYTLEDGSWQDLFFHAVIAEDHTASAVLTKYPVQTGLHITNHSIRQNRSIKLTGAITDVQIEGSSSYRDYGSEASTLIKDRLMALINNGIECQVVTNLGVYEPVVFTRFNTKQKAGMMDSIEFEITGEEVIKVDTLNKTAPSPVSFTPVTGAERDAIIQSTNSRYIRCGVC